MNFLRKLKESQDYTNDYLAELLAISVATVKRYLSGASKIPSDLNEFLCYLLTKEKGNEHNVSLNQALFDWLSLTFHGFTLEEVQETILGIPQKFWIAREYAGNGYTHSVYCNAIDIFYSESKLGKEMRKDINVRMRGFGCRDFEYFLKEQFSGLELSAEELWLMFFQRIEEHKKKLVFDSESESFVQKRMNVSRLDIALDEFWKGKHAMFDLDMVEILDKHGLFEMNRYYKTLEYNKGGGSGLVEYDDWGNEIAPKGLTIYVGGVQSEFRLAMYKKDIESAKKFKMSLEEVREELHYGNRYELRFKGEKANAMLEEILQGKESIVNLAVGYLNTVVVAVYEPSMNGELMMNEKWYQLFSEKQNLKLSIDPKISTIERKVNFLITNKQSLFMIKTFSEQVGFPVYKLLTKDVELNEQNARMLENAIAFYQEANKENQELLLSLFGMEKLSDEWLKEQADEKDFEARVILAVHEIERLNKRVYELEEKEKHLSTQNDAKDLQILDLQDELMRTKTKLKGMEVYL